MNKTRLFLNKHSSTILTFIGAAGVVATSVLAVKATPKALKLIEDERQRREDSKILFNNDGLSIEKVIVPDLTTLEKVKLAWKPYIPAVITGVSTIACIFGANIISKHLNLSANYKVVGSYGKGRWTDVPWIAIFDSRITTSALKGVYIVYLLNIKYNYFYWR